MRLGHLIAAFLLLAASGPHAHAAPAGSDPAGQPGDPIVTATRQNAFTIPFRIEPPQTPAAGPVEVQLHVSTDQGATWAPSSRVRPEKGAFVFRAPHDGEYWYSIRTVDGAGITRPETPLAPQLKVTVDTVAPRLDVSVARGGAGEIVARWQAVDPNLKQGSFKLEYQATSTGPWQRVAVESPPSAMRHTLSGEATWWPNAANGPILVRAEISDLAGNPAVTQAVVKPLDSASPSEAAGRADAESWRGGNAANQPTNNSTRWPPDRAMDRRLGSTGDRRMPPTGGPTSDAYPSSAPAGYAPDENPRASATSVSNNRLGRPGSALDFSVLPAAVRPRMVGSRNFELEYEIESVGPSGVGRVELWGTRDGGRTWSDYAVDADNRSPMAVTVNGEGIYGFRILVQSGSGFGGRPPAEGDVPDIWIGVDTTRPTCRIAGTEVSPDATELLVRWEAFDDVLDPRPVTLLFAASPNGPWTPIASGLENTGSYRWRLESRVPERIVLRLEVRDEAGNVGVHDTADPVALDRHRPAGRIRGVRPISNP
ncbi:MAG: hypothetical protein WD063_06690 [Pirellulales bacterium]